MKELIPCAVLPAKTSADYGEVEFDFVTLVPDGNPALVRQDGRILVGLQTRFNSGDLSHDLAGALVAALAKVEAGEQGVVAFDVRDPAPRLQDILDLDAPSQMDIHQDFEFWLDPQEERDAEVQAWLRQNQEDLVPTEQVGDLEGMYWCQMNNNFVRWVTEFGEDDLFTALARLQAAGDANLGEGSKFVGAFRASGVAIPVFQVDSELQASDFVDAGQVLEEKLAAALEQDAPLTDEERRARAGLVSRQVTVR